ncbi:hypothetical protein DYBT9275_00343 [Dyadobacter sp. CECT 9275]|uniref:DUF692 family protein n=1 Tax=Dyadobacter helix TaxID=2822344 RepID=A0A916J867_9BACT|nr:DUF692 family multinuclear iron-containing protein [Dyadobacter sp. CECT 9275]CAG4989682.1 hypothetical protein DYBT9275_00343 [Dyadobacter sp. CECT 9275]
MSGILPAIACNLDINILRAVLPLLEEEKVEAIEWSFDSLYKYDEIPAWFESLMQEFGDQGRLVGHGVFFSLFAGKWLPQQQHWLDRLRILSKTYRFDHITEHFGFMTGEDFHKGAPISIPFTAQTLALGRDRLARIQDAASCPVGLENLAFAYSVEEVKKHGQFLDQLVQPVNGFIILDLHNLYCQTHNFNITHHELMALYPLEKVREIHISGGSWDESPFDHKEKIRRDTHDHAVPAEVFELLKIAVSRCPHLKFVVLEQLGTGLDTEESQIKFQEDFMTMRKIIEESNDGSRIPYSFIPLSVNSPDAVPAESFMLFDQQRVLSEILETSSDYEEVRMRLNTSILAHSDWGIESWKPEMLYTAMSIAQKWKNGFA